MLRPGQELVYGAIPATAKAPGTWRVEVVTTKVGPYWDLIVSKGERHDGERYRCS